MRLKRSAEKWPELSRFKAIENLFFADPYQSKEVPNSGLGDFLPIELFDFALLANIPALGFLAANDANLDFTVGNSIDFLVGTSNSSR
jgi:hypothetical protein